MANNEQLAARYGVLKKVAEEAAKGLKDVNQKVDDLDIPENVSDLTNDLQFQTKEQVDATVAEKISAVRRNGGSYKFAELPEPSKETLGLTFDVIDAFTTDARFREGTGVECVAGTNVEVAEKKGGGYEYDLLAGNMADYVKKDGDKVLSDNNFSNEDVEKLAGIHEGATAVSKSETNGHININGTDTEVVKFVDDIEAKAELEEIFHPSED